MPEKYYLFFEQAEAQQEVEPPPPVAAGEANPAAAVADPKHLANYNQEQQGGAYDKIYLYNRRSGFISW